MKNTLKNSVFFLNKFNLVVVFLKIVCYNINIES